MAKNIKLDELEKIANIVFRMVYVKNVMSSHLTDLVLLFSLYTYSPNLLVHKKPLLHVYTTNTEMIVTAGLNSSTVSRAPYLQFFEMGIHVKDEGQLYPATDGLKFVTEFKRMFGGNDGTYLFCS